jgi:hypothetical protein
MFILDGKQISSAAPFTVGDVNYPQNWIALASPADRLAIGITEVAEAPMPDTFYALVRPDPDHPGQWLTTPYTANEMKPRLESYSRQKCSDRMNAGIVQTIGPDTFTIRTDETTRNAFFNLRLIQERPGAPIHTPYDFGSKVVALTEGILLDIEQKMEDRAHDCLVTQLNLQAQIAAGSVTLKDQIDAAYNTVL